MVETFFDLALWVAGAGHFLLPIAGLQLPYRLKWKADLVTVHPFTRKLLWSYLGFITFVILAFGLLTLIFHQTLLLGTPLAIGLSLFIGLFWLARVLIDFIYFEHRDWPAGRRFVVAHVLLISLDIFLALTYLSLAMWHLLG